MSKKNERTSKRVAAIAGKVLQKCGELNAKCDLFFIGDGPKKAPPNFCQLFVTIGDLKALAASALTQTAPLPKFASGISHAGKPPEDKPRRKRLRTALRKLRPYTVDAADIPELGETFAEKPKRKAKRKTKRKVSRPRTRNPKGLKGGRRR